MRPSREQRIVKYEESAEYKTGLAGWVCSICGINHGAEEHIARSCCSNDKPCKCGKRNTGHYINCEACTNRDRNEMERRKMERAEVVKYYGGPFMVDDKFYHEAWEYLEDCNLNGYRPQNFLFVPDTLPVVRIPFGYIEDILSDDQYEDFEVKDLDGIDELQEAWEKFGIQNQEKKVYYEGTKQKVDIRELISEFEKQTDFDRWEWDS